MVFTRFVLPFSAGVVVGVMLHKYWPQISEAGRPLLRTSLRSGVDALEKGREVFHQKSEQFSDIIAEIREEEVVAAKTGHGPAPANPPAEPRKS